MRRSLSLLFACALVSLIALSGCSSSTPSSSSGSLSATSLYSTTGSTVYQYSLAASSTGLAATATITVPGGFTARSVTTDSSGNIYVGGTATISSVTTGEVLVYSAGATGSATPIRTIIGGSTGTNTTTFGLPVSIEVSAAGTLAILSSSTSGYAVSTLPALSNGTVTPTTFLQGSSTAFTSSLPTAVSIDGTGDIYIATAVSGQSYIYEFAPTTTGNVAPTASLTLPSGYSAFGVDVDGNGNVFTALDNSSNVPEIVKYPVGATGAALPTQTITGSSTTMYSTAGLRLDAAGEIYVLNTNSNSTINFLGFAKSANGNAAPTLSIVPATESAAAANSEIAVR